MINPFEKFSRLLPSFNTQRSKLNASVYIPFESRTSIGGPATFLKNLHTYLDKAGFAYANSLDQATVILFPISYDIKALEKFRKRGGKICQRLDGVYYPERHGDEFVRRNQKIKDIYLRLADHVVFQSEYSRAQCFDMFGTKNAADYSIIINGVNAEIFYPDHLRRCDPRHIHFCTTGNIRSIDMLAPVIKALDLIAPNYQFTFHVVGPIKDPACAALMSRPYIVHHDNCTLEQVAAILRASDVFIYSLLNPPCPNSVVEAIACGIPVVGFKSGAMPELLSFSPELLADAGSKLFQSLDDLSPELLAEKLKEVINHYAIYRQRSLEAVPHYSMDHCGSRYVAVLERLLKSAAPGA